MDNRSFSLQFNPLMNVKCVKDYEEEIAKLKAENFELKAQITHANIPKVLYENKQEIDAMASRQAELQGAYENLNMKYQSVVQEKQMLENKYNQELLLAEERNAFMEDENKRILLRLEKMNKEMQEAMAIKEAIQTQEKQFEQQRYFYEKELEEIRKAFEQYRSDAEAECAKKEREIENISKKYEQVHQKEKNSSFIISDLKATVHSQMKDKATIEDLLNKNQSLETALKNHVEAEQKQKKEQKNYYNGMEKFKSIITKKLNDVQIDLQETANRVLKLKEFGYISEESGRLLNKLGAKYTNVNELIVFFKEKHQETQKKIEMLKKEAADAAFFASNTKATIEKKTAGFLQDFKEQFDEAKNELLLCRKYLEKKALENKMLKTENGKLLNEASMRTKQMEAMGKLGFV